MPVNAFPAIGSEVKVPLPNQDIISATVSEKQVIEVEWRNKVKVLELQNQCLV